MTPPRRGRARFAQLASSGRVRARDLLVGALLCGAVLLLFWRVTGTAEFHDDDQYVTDVPQVRAGVTAAGVRWAFTTTRAEFWHPVTWLSLMLDRQVAGPGMAGFHRSALLLHLGAAVLLFVAARRLTGSRSAGLVTALLFAVHPGHVGTFAWVADRKDLLAALFCFLALVGYHAYAARPGAARYLLAWTAFALGLMSKPSLVALPAVLLVLDWWPLGRRQPGAGAVPVGRLLLEKVPLLALSLAMAAVAYWAQARAGGVLPLEAVGARARLTNALVSGVDYLQTTAWPAGLASFYPHPGSGVPLARAVLALALLAGLAALAIHGRRRHPSLLAGGAWFAGMLLPVMGLIQVGEHAMADRYAYVPHAGLFLGGAWWLSRRAARLRGLRPAALAAVAVAIVALAAAAWREAGFWSDAVTRYRRDLAVAGESWFTRFNLGVALMRERRHTEAEEQFRAALRIDPERARGPEYLGRALAAQGRLAEAEARVREAARLAPDDAGIRDTLARILSSRGDLAEAEAVGREAVSRDPRRTESYVVLATILAGQDRHEEAIAWLEEAVRLDPDDPDDRYNLALANERLGRWEAAAAGYRRAIELGAGDGEVRSRLAAVLGGRGGPRGAVQPPDRPVPGESPRQGAPSR